MNARQKLKNVAHRLRSLGFEETATFVRTYAVACPPRDTVNGTSHDCAVIAGQGLRELAQRMSTNDVLRRSHRAKEYADQQDWPRVCRLGSVR